MIKFFRNIRKTVLAEGKTGNYLKYAIGEIVLVVIGILIALQINNWNEQRKDNIKENHIVKSLYDEFIDNYHYIDERKQEFADSHEKYGLALLKLCSQNHADISADSLLALIEESFFAPGYSPKISTFRRIINNEEFNFIQQDSLKTLLNQYETTLQLTFKSNKQIFDHEDELWVYSNDKFGGLNFVKKLDAKYLGLFNTINDAELTFNVNDIVSDRVFESILAHHLQLYSWALNRLNELQELNKTIRDYIDRHYKI
ncbi:MAG TPA: hypothetical protein VJ945_02970 [Flavobacteriaceae bacterium]|nr:hypothetical protein [Flavobacteriaceae bacterium]